MINIITDAITGLFVPDINKENKFIEKLVKEDLTGLPEDVFEDIVCKIKNEIRQSYDNWLNYEDDRFFTVLADPDEERAELFVDDFNWRRREYLNMCHWHMKTKFWLSSIYED